MHNEIDNRHEVIQVVFCSNPQYCEHMAVAIASLLAHNPSRRFKLHVVLSGTGEHEKDCIQQLVEKSGNAVIEFRSFDCNTISDFRIDDHITLDSYVRLFLPEILGPEVGKLLYLDCDLLVCADIAELWNTDLGNQILGAVPDAFSEDHVSLGFEEHETYFNAGVLLIDLRRWRSSNLTERAVEYIRTNKTVLRHHDQDAWHAPASPVLVHFPARLLQFELWRACQSDIGRCSAEAREIMTVIVVLGDQHRVVRVGMLVPAIGQEHHSADLGGASPEFREQFALQADVFHPLAIFGFVRLRNAPPIN